MVAEAEDSSLNLQTQSDWVYWQNNCCLEKCTFLFAINLFWPSRCLSIEKWSQNVRIQVYTRMTHDFKMPFYHCQSGQGSFRPGINDLGFTFSNVEIVIQNIEKILKYRDIESCNEKTWIPIFAEFKFGPNPPFWAFIRLSKQGQNRNAKSIYQVGMSILGLCFPPCFKTKSQRGFELGLALPQL